MLSGDNCHSDSNTKTQRTSLSRFAHDMKPREELALKSESSFSPSRPARRRWL
jgi:hypothetical protein